MNTPLRRTSSEPSPVTRNLRSRVGLGVLVCTLAAATGCQVVAGITPGSVPVVPEQQVATATVDWKHALPGAQVFIDLCRRPVDDPEFDLARDCDPASALELPGTPTGKGSAEVELFVGPTQSWLANGSAPWACVPPGEAAPQGVEPQETCFVRVAWFHRANPIGADSRPYSFVLDSAEIPEAPWVLLPALLGLLGTGSWLLLRRRFA